MQKLKLTRRAVLAAAFAIVATPLVAGDMDDTAMHGPSITLDNGFVLHDPYMRLTPKSGAAFFGLENKGVTDDRLIGASSPIARKVELHTHVMIDGVARMMPIEGGIAVPQGAMHMLARGGDHVMFMGLTQKPEQGDLVEVTLTFETSGDFAIQIPVDNRRKGGGSMLHMDSSDNG